MKTQVRFNLQKLDDIYRHSHNAFLNIIAKHREKLLTNDHTIFLYDEYFEEDKKVEKVRKEFESLYEYNT